MADRQVRAIITELDRFTGKLVAALATNIVAELVETTPVDTGWARANWVPTIGVANTTPAGLADASRVPGQRAVQQSAVAALQSYRISRGNVFISNNVPYIGKLNDGSSAQAPAGFVQFAIARGVRNTLGSLRQ